MVVDVGTQEPSFIDELALLTFRAFREQAPNWLPTIENAREEVVESLQRGRTSRALTDDLGEPLGWLGAIPQSGGRAWKIHPIAIRPERQGRGYSRFLVEDLERISKASGALTLFAGASDDVGSTSLSGTDLYADPLSALASITCEGPHAYKFWMEVGFSTVGVMPDAEGVGRHGIHLAKSLVGKATAN